MAEDVDPNKPDEPQDIVPHDLKVQGKDDQGRYVFRNEKTGRQMWLSPGIIKGQLPELQPHVEAFEKGAVESAGPGPGWKTPEEERQADQAKAFNMMGQQVASQGGNLAQGPVPNAPTQAINGPQAAQYAAAMQRYMPKDEKANQGPGQQQQLAQAQGQVSKPQAGVPVGSGAGGAGGGVGGTIVPPPGPTTAGLYAAGARQLEDAARKQYENTVLTGQKLRPIEDYNADELTHLYDSQKKAQADLEARLGIENKKMTDIRDQLLQHATIDPNRFWKDKSALGKVGFALGSALMGIGGGLSGNPGAAVNQVNAMVNRDIDAQQKTVQNLGEAARVQGNLVQEFRNQGLDRIKAAEAARALLKDQIVAKYGQVANQMAEPTAKAALLQTLGTLKTDSSKKLMDIAKTRAEIQHLQSEAYKAYAQARGIQSKPQPLTPEQMVSGVRKAIDEFKQKLSQSGPGDILTGSAEARRRDLALQVAQTLSGGKQPRPELTKVIESTLPGDVSAFFGGAGSEEKMRALEEEITRMAPLINAKGTVSLGEEE